ncbi:MAG: hypothetical protein QOC59_401 [Microbacteriaceae bacterium]|jgi:hypothetical protein|nr:hypothetical protein [Microbacteriaceae bacterium]
MPRVELDIETPVAPERVRNALLDFSPDRPAIWPGIEPSLYEVYSVGTTTAEIQEGNRVPGGAVWAKEHYDWSDPETVTWTVVESNFCAPGSRVKATIRPNGSGGSRIHIDWSRTPISFSGRLGMLMVTGTRGAPIRASIRKALARLEATS